MYVMELTTGKMEIANQSLNSNETELETEQETETTVSSHILPDNPLVVIEPSHSWVALSLRELWNQRELLYFLTWRDIKVRYKQTALGAAWAVLQPLAQTL